MGNSNNMKNHPDFKEGYEGDVLPEVGMEDESIPVPIGVESSILIPKTINGAPVLPKTLDSLLKITFDYFGSYVLLDNAVMGMGLDRESCWTLKVAFDPDSSKDYEAFKALALWVKSNLSQESVQFTIGTGVYII